MKNITLSVNDVVLERARAVARRRGRSLNALIREYLDDLAGNSRRARMAEELDRLWASGGGRSGGRRINRADAYEGRA